MENTKKKVNILAIILIVIVLVLLGIIIFLILDRGKTSKEKESIKNKYVDTTWYLYINDEYSDSKIEFNKNTYKVISGTEISQEGSYYSYDGCVVLENSDDIALALFEVDNNLCFVKDKCYDSKGIFYSSKDRKPDESDNSARKSSFVLYAEKVITAVQTQFIYDSEMGELDKAGVYVYDITTDLSLTSTGSYSGYVVVDNTLIDDPSYYLYLHDNEFMILGYNVTYRNMPTIEDVEKYDSKEALEVMKTAYYPCQKVWNIIDPSKSNKEYGRCSNRTGFTIEQN